MKLRCFLIVSALAIALGVSSGTLAEQSSTFHDGSFTDSTGRTILYRYWIRSDWDTSTPRGLLLFLHGNNTGTADELRRVRWFDYDAAHELGLAVAVLASPAHLSHHPSSTFSSETLGDSEGTRNWFRRDARLIHELLQSGFGSELAVDQEQIVFVGASQGTCFLAHFLEQYAGVYGGGFHAWCGCFWANGAGWPTRRIDEWAPTFQWTPFGASFVRDRLRVFVEATTEDFLFEHAVAMTQYYGGVLDLETRWDLETPGGHCANGSTPRAEIWEWLSAADAPERAGEESDADGDGIPNVEDLDDDNDGALDFIDALPLDSRDWLDRDRDGVGDANDRDADGDGVDNALDPFPQDPLEWSDADGDGIGDTLDADDDNDGLPDVEDSHPLKGTANDALTFRMIDGSTRSSRVAWVHARRPSAVVYPKPEGTRVSYQFINLGDSPDTRFELMVDRLDRETSCEAVLLPELCDPLVPEFNYFEHYVDKVYIDRNQNRNLTDDGPPLFLAKNNDDHELFPSTTPAILHVPYASGDVLPFAVKVSTNEELSGELSAIRYRGVSGWMGYVKPPSSEEILVATIDGNSDGIFDSVEPAFGINDFICIDLDRNGVLNECDKRFDEEGLYAVPVNPVLAHREFALDSCRYSVAVPPSGQRLTWSAFGPAADPGAPLVASLSVASMPLAGVPVVFDGSASTGAESYRWDFGDGTVIEHPSTGSQPSHTYVEAGSYRVRLEIRRGCDCGDQFCEYDTATAMVDVLPRPLTARLVTPSMVETGMAVVFDGSGSVGAESYRWDFGDGTEIEHPNVVSRPSHTYVEPGSYEVRLEVARGGDCGSQLCEYDTATAMVDVLPRPLTARLVTPSMVETGMAVVFDGSGSVGAESYRWDFGDGTEIEHPNVVSRPSHTYVEPGSYEVRLEVARGGDCGSEYCETETATAMLEVEAGALPAARFDLDTDCSDELCVVGTDSRVTFRDLSSGTVAGRSWDFGDGVMSSEAEATHSWSSPGFYRVVLTASGLGATSMVSRDILVRASDPAGTCEPNAETLCLQDSRYELRVDWWTGAGESGTGSVVHAGTNDSGLFWFFDADNWEILIKVLDGCALNGRVWVYGASTTDQGYSIRVTDTVSGEFEVYRNEAGRPASAITDNEAFSAACQEGASAVAGSETDGADGLPGFTLEPLSQVSGNSGSGCTGSDSSLCLADGRFEVNVDWSTADGKRGPASTISVGTNNSGLFYFFDPGNWEMLIKVLDGCAFNDHHWVYAASATDQGLDITVTDTATGEMWTHSKAPGQPAPAITASEAFPDSCSR